MIIAIHAQLLRATRFAAAITAFPALTAELLQVQLGHFPKVPLYIVLSVHGAIIGAFRVARSRPERA